MTPSSPDAVVVGSGHNGIDDAVTLAAANFGRRAILPASAVARRWHTDEARAIMAGASAHAMLPLTAVPTAGVGLMLTGLAHAVGWPVVAGGSARITDAMADALRAMG